MAQENIKDVTLTAAGGTFMFDLFGTSQNVIEVTSSGSITLAANVIINRNIPPMGTLTDTYVKIRWTAKKTNSFLKTLINSDDYYIISPEYIVSQFLEIKKSCPNKNFKEIQKNLKEHLNEILQTAFEYIDNFRMSYNEIVSSYVYEHPLEYKFGSNYVKGFINTIILLIIDLVDDLISLHVYAIHPIISDIINVYTPLDIVNEFFNDNNNKELYIV